MKWLLAVVLSGGLAFAGVYCWLSARNDAELAAEKAAHGQALRAERDRITSDTQSPRSTVAPVISSLPAAVSKNASPAEIIDRLKAMRAGVTSDQKNHSLRVVIHLLETLAEHGSGAIPAIKAFLALNEDVNYPTGATEILAINQSETITAVRVTTDFALPPSLRLGLVDVLREIGGPEAQKVLMRVLLTSGRGVEVALAAKALEGMAPGVYRDSALSAAKDLLNNPLTVQSPDQLDRNAKAYLYSVLKMYNDTSFAESAKGLLISNGSIDHNAADYLATVVKDAAVPALMDAYNSLNPTNRLDKPALTSNLLGFVGRNARANQMFSELVTNTNTAPAQRAIMIMRLAGLKRGGVAIEAPKDQAQISAMSGLLSNLSQTTSDPIISQALKVTLNSLATGKPLEGDAASMLTTISRPAGPGVGVTAVRQANGTILRTVTRETPGAPGQVYPGTDIRQADAQPATTKPRGPIQVISPGQ